MLKRFCMVAVCAVWMVMGVSQAMAVDLAERIHGAPMALPDSFTGAFDAIKLEEKGEQGPRFRYAARQDAAIISDWLKSEGYLDVQVETLFPDAGGVEWQVTPGERWRIGAVEVEPEPPGDVELPKVGDSFRSSEYEAAKTSLRGAWNDAGYLHADFAEAAVYPDHDSKHVRIVWHIVPGEHYHIGSVSVSGAKQYDPDLAIRLSQLHMGEVPTAKTIRDAVRSISSDSHYRSAAILPELSKAEGDAVPMRIEVNEAARYALEGSVGYSTDKGVEVAGSWTDRGLMDGFLEYSLHGSYSNLVSGVGMTLARPVWPGSRDRTGISIDFLNENTAGQKFRTFTGGPFWQRQFLDNDYVRAELLQNWITGSGERIRTLEPAITLHLDHHLGEGVPFGGWRVHWKISMPSQTNGSGRWLVTRIDGRSFHAVGGSVLLSPRAGYGRTLNIRGSAPKSMRQYAGGTSTVRGYKLDSLGPIGPDGLAQGGLQAVNAGLDVVFRTNATIMPVLFSDIGQVWSTPQNKGKPFWSLGAGVIGKTPIGPVRVDIAVPQSRRPQDPKFQIYFAFGEVL